MTPPWKSPTPPNMRRGTGASGASRSSTKSWYSRLTAIPTAFPPPRLEPAGETGRRRSSWRLGAEQPQVHFLPHRRVAGAVRVQPVARSAGGRVRLECRFQRARRWIQRRRRKVDHAVEQPGTVEEL